MAMRNEFLFYFVQKNFETDVTITKTSPLNRIDQKINRLVEIFLKRKIDAFFSFDFDRRKFVLIEKNLSVEKTKLEKLLFDFPSRTNFLVDLPVFVRLLRHFLICLTVFIELTIKPSTLPSVEIVSLERTLFDDRHNVSPSKTKENYFHVTHLNSVENK